MQKVYNVGLGNIIGNGLLAGFAGVTVMTIGEKIEQCITGRPSSYVPGHTLERLLGLPQKPDSERFLLNHTMHFGQGMIAGCIRTSMAVYGIQGPVSSFIFTFIRLLIDQTLENVTGVGALPWTWPWNEQVIDILHKAVYAFVTGAVSDYLISRNYLRIKRD